MAQQVIDGTLYSPVLAHALRKGDMIQLRWGKCRLTSNPTPYETTNLRADAVIIDIDIAVAGTETWLNFWRNEPVLRAVGATAGGLL